MDDELVQAIAALLEERGYRNVQCGGGTVWYEDDEGLVHTLSETDCEGRWED